MVMLLDSAGNNYETGTNDSGNFSFRGSRSNPIAPGPIEIGASHDGKTKSTSHQRRQRPERHRRDPGDAGRPLPLAHSVGQPHAGHGRRGGGVQRRADPGGSHQRPGGGREQWRRLLARDDCRRRSLRGARRRHHRAAADATQERRGRRGRGRRPEERRRRWRRSGGAGFPWRVQRARRQDPHRPACPGGGRDDGGRHLPGGRADDDAQPAAGRGRVPRPVRRPAAARAAPGLRPAGPRRLGRRGVRQRSRLGQRLQQRPGLGRGVRRLTRLGRGLQRPGPGSPATGRRTDRPLRPQHRDLRPGRRPVRHWSAGTAGRPAGATARSRAATAGPPPAPSRSPATTARSPGTAAAATARRRITAARRAARTAPARAARTAAPRRRADTASAAATARRSGGYGSPQRGYGDDYGSPAPQPGGYDPVPPAGGYDPAPAAGYDTAAPSRGYGEPAGYEQRAEGYGSPAGYDQRGGYSEPTGYEPPAAATTPQRRNAATANQPATTRHRPRAATANPPGYGPRGYDPVPPQRGGYDPVPPQGGYGETGAPQRPGGYDEPGYYGSAPQGERGPPRRSGAAAGPVAPVAGLARRLSNAGPQNARHETWKRPDPRRGGPLPRPGVRGRLTGLTHSGDSGDSGDGERAVSQQWHCARDPVAAGEIHIGREAPLEQQPP